MKRKIKSTEVVKESNDLKNKNGISLIALAITIIVLLILAGVTISTLTGDNGLLTKATNSKGETIKAEGLERLKLAVVASYDNNGKVDTQNLAKNLSQIEGLKYINEQNVEVDVLENTEIKLAAKVKLKENTFRITNKGNVSYKKEGTAYIEDILKSPYTYYGRYVTNYNSPNDAGINASEGQKWQIFMADEDSIYLIASNYITRQYTGTKNNVGYNYDEGNQTPATATTMWFTSILGQYNAKSTITDIPAILSKLDNQNVYHKWMNTEANQTRNNGNDRAVTSMLDIDVWNGYKNIIYAKYAIGGPSIEMFCKAYNDTRTTGTALLEAKDTNADNTYGYRIQKGTANPANSVSGLKIGAINTIVDDMYFKSSTEGSNYWLASPSAQNGGSDVISVYNTGGVGLGGNISYARDRGFRPLVCLKSNVHLVEKTNGTTTTYELELD